MGLGQSGIVGQWRSVHSLCTLPSDLFLLGVSGLAGGNRHCSWFRVISEGSFQALMLCWRSVNAPGRPSAEPRASVLPCASSLVLGPVYWLLLALLGLGSASSTGAAWVPLPALWPGWPLGCVLEPQGLLWSVPGSQPSHPFATHTQCLSNPHFRIFSGAVVVSGAGSSAGSAESPVL